MKMDKYEKYSERKCESAQTKKSINAKMIKQERVERWK